MNGSTFLIGPFITSLIAFLSIVVVFFIIVKPMARIKRRMDKPSVPVQPTKRCRYCLSNVPLKATRCPFCTSRLKA